MAIGRVAAGIPGIARCISSLHPDGGIRDGRDPIRHIDRAGDGAGRDGVSGLDPARASEQTKKDRHEQEAAQGGASRMNELGWLHILLLDGSRDDLDRA